MLNHKIVEAFAKTRHQGLSFPFLKENGELLSISAKSGLKFSQESLNLYQDLYQNALNLVEIYPQFFRFFLGMILDLEALGMEGEMGKTLIDYVLAHDLYAQETSDTRRLEILNMLAMQGQEPDYHSDSKDALENRVRTFFGNPDHFIKFNRPLFYELTHVVFFLTNFGRRDFEDKAALVKTLTHVGLIALLDNDTDLLSEVCLCFTYLKEQAPEDWKTVCTTSIDSIKIKFETANKLDQLPPVDEYHAYVVINWFIQSNGGKAFVEDFQSGVPVFEKTNTMKSPLASISHKLHNTILSTDENGRSSKYIANSILDDAQLVHLKRALASTPVAAGFFDKLTHGQIILA